jgi:hypothetical protein
MWKTLLNIFLTFIAYYAWLYKSTSSGDIGNTNWDASAEKQKDISTNINISLYYVRYVMCGMPEASVLNKITQSTQERKYTMLMSSPDSLLTNFGNLLFQL